MFLDDQAPMKVERTDQDISGFLTSIRRKDRASLDAKQLIALKSKSEEAMEPKFALYKAYAEEDGLKSLAATYSVHMRIEQFRGELKRYDMDHVFMLPDEFVIDTTVSLGYKPSPMASPIDLFTDSRIYPLMM